MNADQQLIADIEAYAAATGMATSTFCKLAGGNSQLLDRMKSGGSVTQRIAERIRAYMRNNPPPGRRCAA